MSHAISTSPWTLSTLRPVHPSRYDTFLPTLTYIEEEQQTSGQSGPGPVRSRTLKTTINDKALEPLRGNSSSNNNRRLPRLKRIAETPSKRWAVKAKDEDNLGLKIGLAFCWPKT
ncbi:unnamed protein product [Fusarium graminearum]|uniref:Chromosome 3, complete genome n=1 Tax=Gibberella zeae (strain ATCC MYA-4620 / CBS 123657 / FGSC 9075 / NRRL 31084 / PH-1) TaxID=229533 RepID=A0A098DX03_GIBZE|nr:unnamed protein product [Fusarium graminearum]CZS85535.1 unnamed protein product [Fusarium graminearum]